MTKHIAVLGAGAIGASIGAYLIRSGHDITLIDQWAAHIDKIKKDGLKLTDLKETFTVKAKAMQLAELSSTREQFDIVYLSVKSYDTLWSTHFIAPFLKPTGCIMPAQNALNDDLVASVVGYHRTVGCVPSISAGVYDPGHVIRTDPMSTHCFTVGELSGVLTPRVKEAAEALEVIGPSDATNNIWGARWAKLLVNCMGNALSGILGPDTSSMTDGDKEVAALIRTATGCEVVRVGMAMGIVFGPLATGNVPAEAFAKAKSATQVKALKDRLEKATQARRLTPEQIKHLGVPGRPSLLQDVIKRRRTEVKELNGVIVKYGQEVGVPAPMNEAIVSTMLRIEQGKGKTGPSNLKKLSSYLPK
jgi:2-dehydropantoate 2-reductase